MREGLRRSAPPAARRLRGEHCSTPGGHSRCVRPGLALLTRRRRPLPPGSSGSFKMRPAHRPAPRHRPSPARRSLRSNFTSTASSPQRAHSPRRRGHHLRRVCVVLMPVPRHMPWLVKHVDKHHTRTNDITHASQPRAGGSEPCHWLWTQSETQECVRVCACARECVRMYYPHPMSSNRCTLDRFTNRATLRALRRFRRLVRCTGIAHWPAAVTDGAGRRAAPVHRR